MKNLKDTLSTICAILLAISGAILALKLQNVILPEIVYTISALIATISASVIGILTGKNPNGTTKVIDPSTGQQNVDPNAVKADEKPT